MTREQYSNCEKGMLQLRVANTQFNAVSSESNDEMIIEGYFSVFEQETELWEGAFEVITRGAFDNTLDNDIRALWNHDSKYVIGRNKANTLELKTDDRGLYARVKLPNTTYAKDLYELVQRGDVNQCSFGFNITAESYEERTDGSILWRVNGVDLHEISVVTFPAYEGTSVEAREKQYREIQTRKAIARKSELRKRLEVLK